MLFPPLRRLRPQPQRLEPQRPRCASAASSTNTLLADPQPIALERLEARELFSVTFDAITGSLIVVGSEGRDRIAVVAQGDGKAMVTGASSGAPGSSNTVFDGVRSIEVHGLGGNDDIFVGNVFDPEGVIIGVYVDGGAGNDVIITGLGDDTVDAGEGHNKVFTDGGDDTISAGAGKDLINSGSGDDEIDAGEGANKVIAGDGDDVVIAGDGNNIISTGTGDDSVTTGAGKDTIFTDGGDDFIDAGDGKNNVDAGSGNDTIITGIDADRINAGAGNDDINAGDGKNIIDAGAGDDIVTAGDGNDTIYTGDGNDVVDAGLGDNTVRTNPRLTARLRFGALPSFVIKTAPLLIAGFGSRGLVVATTGRILDSFGFSGGVVFGQFGRPASPVISPPLYSFTAIIRL